MGMTVAGSGPALAQIGELTDEPEESVDQVADGLNSATDHVGGPAGDPGDQVGDTASDATDEVGDAAGGLRDGAGGVTDGVTGDAGGAVGSTSDGEAAGDVTGAGGTILDGAPGVGARSADRQNSAAATESSDDAEEVAAGGDEVAESEAPPGLCVGFAESFCADLMNEGLTGLLFENFDAGGELLSAFADALPLSGLDLVSVIVTAAVLGLAGALLVRRSRRAPG
jgi:hypothetical protein